MFPRFTGLSMTRYKLQCDILFFLPLRRFRGRESNNENAMQCKHVSITTNQPETLNHILITLTERSVKHSTQRWTWAGSIHGLGWVGLRWVEILANTLGWVGLGWTGSTT